MRRRLFRRDAGGITPGLDVGALAPLVDMMTLMLVFLLRSYSTESAPMPPEGRFELAGTTSEAALATASSASRCRRSASSCASLLSTDRYTQGHPAFKEYLERMRHSPYLGL